MNAANEFSGSDYVALLCRMIYDVQPDRALFIFRSG